MLLRPLLPLSNLKNSSDVAVMTKCVFLSGCGASCPPRRRGSFYKQPHVVVFFHLNNLFIRKMLAAQTSSRKYLTAKMREAAQTSADVTQNPHNFIHLRLINASFECISCGGLMTCVSCSTVVNIIAMLIF